MPESGGHRGESVLSFLSFEDWLSKDETKSEDWIVVAQTLRNGPTDLFTFSVLARRGEKVLETLLSRNDWEVRLDFGRPSFLKAKDEIRYDPGVATKVEGMDFVPFIIFREFHGYIRKSFELAQEFLLYHEAFYAPEVSEFQRIDDDGNVRSVAKLTQDGENVSLQVDVHDLRDYLAAKQSYLVRYHDHTRWAKEDITTQIGAQFVRKPVKDDHRSFELWLRTDIRWQEQRSSSRLLGKDLLQPYDEPDERHTSWATGNENRKHAKFIVRRSDRGVLVESTCDERELSNYFVDRGTPHFLTPVFFRREVLSKYYNEPRRYRVSESGVACLDLWSMPIDITDEGLVQVWLGDLGSIPYPEQLQWRAHNVPRRGTITRRRFLRDFMAQPIEPVDPVYQLRTAFEEVQAATLDRRGMRLFLELGTKDVHHYDGLHLPLTEEWKEFDEQVQSLAKIAVDSLNVGLLTKVTGKEIDKVKIKGSIDLLEAYLGSLSLNADDSRNVVEAFRAVQALRSAGAAHRKGKKFEETLIRYKLANLSNRDRFGRVVSELAAALAGVAQKTRAAH